jgi:TrmH RNA methyltransferase
MKRSRRTPRDAATTGTRRPAGRSRPASARPASARPASAGPDGSRPASLRHKSRSEETYHGLRACLAIFARRPQDVVRVYVTAERRREAAALLRHCTESRKGFQVLAAENLARISGSMHHEGIAVLARACRRWTLADVLQAPRHGPLLYLDGVQNPHNLGALLRTAAHFDVAAILGPRGGLPSLSPAAVRVAEGAAEFVPVCDVEKPVTDLRLLQREGFAVVVTSSHRGRSAFEASAGWGERVVLVLGSEGEGVSPPIAALADEFVCIPGTEQVESLNVSVACGILLGECWRRKQDRLSGPSASRSGT